MCDDVVVDGLSIEQKLEVALSEQQQLENEKAMLEREVRDRSVE